MSKAINSGGAPISSSPARLRDRFNVILSENASPARTEGSRYVTLKVPQRDSSTDARNDSGGFVYLKRFPRFPHVARAIFETGELLQKGQGNFANRSVALFGNDQFRFALLLRARLLVFLINLRPHEQPY